MAAGPLNARRPLAAGLCRLAAAACCLPIFWAGFDQVLLAQAASGDAPAPGPQNDDDDMAQPAAAVRPDRPASPATPAAAPTPGRTPPRPPLAGASPPLGPRCEHDLRNGFGGPLLC
jgi:hypothetical protein